jgi:signal transduction histidine kinase
MAVSFLATVVADYLAPWPYVMTPLYALPVLIAAHRLGPRTVAVTAVVVTLANVVSSLVQGTPATVWPLYTLGLVITSYLAVGLAYQRQVSARHIREAEEHARDAEAARQSLREFISMVSHELRTPVTAVLGSAQLLIRRQARSSDDVTERTLVAVEQAAQRMRRLLDDLVDAGRAGAGHFSVVPAPVDLAEVVREVAALRGAAAPLHHLDVELPSDSGALRGTWDRARLEQVLANFVSNAARYAPEGTEIRITARRDGDAVVLGVSDHGPGIAEEDAARLFQPFSRLRRDAGIPGMGLGLYLCKAIVEAHGGRIWVESRVGEGSTFWISLPPRPAGARR